MSVIAVGTAELSVLATSVFERICVSDPRVRSRLRPCDRRLVSADSSPLTVRGELDMTVVFPGLSCDMILVVASIGSDGLLGTEALQSCSPHQLDVGGGPVDAPVTSKEAGSSRGCSPDHFGSAAPG